MESSLAYCPYEKPYAVSGGQTCCDRRLGSLPLDTFEDHCDAAMSGEKEGRELLAPRKHLNHKDTCENNLLFAESNYFLRKLLQG